MPACLLAAALLLTEPTPTLEPSLQALLMAASEAPDQDAFEQAVRLISLTHDPETVAAGAFEISASHGARALLVLGLPATPSSPAPMPTVAAVEVEVEVEVEAEVEAEAETETEMVETETPSDPIWIAAPHQAWRFIGQAKSDLWTGRARLGVRADSGDSERLDYTIGLDADRELVGWGFETSAIYSYSETNNRVGRDELIVKARGEREAGERWTLFTNTEWERDQLSGFDWTGFLGLGAGYRALQEDPLKWTLRAAPGVRYQREADNGDRSEAALDLLSDMEWQMNDAVRLESETRMLVANNSRADQLFKLNTALGELWSLEVRYRYRYELNPEPGFEAGDSRTDLSLVREF